MSGEKSPTVETATREEIVTSEYVSRGSDTSDVNGVRCCAAVAMGVVIGSAMSHMLADYDVGTCGLD